MTERQVWKTIADAYTTPRSKRTKKQRHITRVGICFALMEIRCYYGDISMWVHDSMYQKVIQSLPPLPHKNVFFCGMYPADDLLRADYCYAMYYSNGAE